MIPTLGALSVASVVVIASLALGKTKKVIFQFFAFGVSLAACVAYLVNNADKHKLSAAWRAFAALPAEVRFVVSLLAIIISYFGGAMYVAPEEQQSRSSTSAKAIFATPASCDTVITFEEPKGFPSDDNKFFEKFLDK